MGKPRSKAVAEAPKLGNRKFKPEGKFTMGILLANKISMLDVADKVMKIGRGGRAIFDYRWAGDALTRLAKLKLGDGHSALYNERKSLIAQLGQIAPQELGMVNDLTTPPGHIAKVLEKREAKATEVKVKRTRGPSKKTMAAALDEATAPPPPPPPVEPRRKAAPKEDVQRGLTKATRATKVTLRRGGALAPSSAPEGPSQPSLGPRRVAPPPPRAEHWIYRGFPSGLVTVAEATNPGKTVPLDMKAGLAGVEQVAMAILVHHLDNNVEEAKLYYKWFAREVLAHLPKGRDWSLTTLEIRDKIASIGVIEEQADPIPDVPMMGLKALDLLVTRTILSGGATSEHEEIAIATLPKQIILMWFTGAAAAGLMALEGKSLDPSEAADLATQFGAELTRKFIKLGNL
jgi:hypothetical protein